MIIRQQKEFAKGYNAIVSLDNKEDIALMDFGIIKLNKEETYLNSENKERAILLIQGEVLVKYNDVETVIKRGSFLDENPVCVHLPKNTEVKLKAESTSELAYQAVYNGNTFEPKIYSKEECITEQFGKNVMNETSLRYVRTIIDDNVAPYSNLVIGEVINFPGKWSSYPPHHHVQPEVYHYRMYPEQGFGFSCEGDDVYIVKDRDTVVIRGGVVHPQVAAPGYAMYYIWMIPHTPKRWIKDRIYLEKDEWLLKDNPKIWPEK